MRRNPVGTHVNTIISLPHSKRRENIRLSRMSPSSKLQPFIFTKEFQTSVNVLQGAVPDLVTAESRRHLLMYCKELYLMWLVLRHLLMFCKELYLMWLELWAGNICLCTARSCA
jgi:hypothetical protein